MNQRTKEDQAAWDAWTEGVRRSENGMALMRRIIDAVDAVRMTNTSDRDETCHHPPLYRYDR